MKFAHLSPPSSRRLVAALMTLCAATALALSSLVAYAQTFTAAQLAEELKQQFAKLGTDEQLTTMVNRAYGVPLSPDKAKVARDGLREIMFHRSFSETAANLLHPVYRPGMPQSEVTAVMLEGMSQIQVQGFVRLPQHRQAAVVRHTVDFARSLPPTTCQALLSGKLSTPQAARLERAYVASLPLPQFTHVTALYTDAAVAQLSNFPDEKAVNAGQAELAQTALNRVAQKRLRSMMSNDALLRVEGDTTSASPQEYCSYFTILLESMLEVPEPYRGWQLTRFMASLK